MNIQILKKKYKDAIGEDQVLKGLVASNNKRTTHTVERWLRDDNELLTTATTLAVLKAYLGLSEKEKLTENLK